jgi:diketogulonate reductase-like aldo/keto reductase
MSLTIHSTKKLNNSNEIPVLGLGTYQMHESAEAGPAVLAALEAGYRLIDTAQMYDNEKAVGDAIRQSGVPREEIFVTTKVYSFDPTNPLAALEASLKNLGLDYVDLYLIHWPIDGWPKLWSSFEEFQRRGLAKNIGVSNFTVQHLEELLALAKVVPQVNQVEFSPFLYQKELLEYCGVKGIALEAYSPLTRGHKLDDSTITRLAAAHGKTSAQVMIRWSLQHGLVVIPKSSKPRRIAENADVFDFELSSAEMQLLDELSQNSHYCWNPEEAD